jgi:hypothetical protein
MLTVFVPAGPARMSDVLEQSDTTVERAAANHVEGNIGKAVVDPLRLLPVMTGG